MIINKFKLDQFLDLLDDILIIVTKVLLAYRDTTPADSTIPSSSKCGVLYYTDYLSARGTLLRGVLYCAGRRFVRGISCVRDESSPKVSLVTSSHLYNIENLVLAVVDVSN